MNSEHKLEIKYEGLVPDAVIFAFNVHSGQYRKVQPQQYIIHPLRVSEFILKNFSHRPSIDIMRLAAILHDTVEDTWATIEDIESRFGKEVAQLVSEVSKPDIDDTKARNEEFKKQLIKGKDDSKIIKLADIFDNAILSTDDHPKWKEYMIKCKFMLEGLELKEKDETYTKIKNEVLKLIDEKLVQYEKH
jgi:(p)ppGpp synthase/HD superfamily hydrolase